MKIKLIKTISIDKIKPDSEQPRKTFDKEELEFLKRSIKSGFQINPIILDENYQIIVGERRWRALKLNGIKKLVEGEHFKIVKGLSEKERRRMQSDEDIQHKLIDLEERDKFWHRIYKKFNFKSKQELADFLNVPYQSVNDAFDRLELRKKITGPVKVAPSVISETRGLPTKERIQLIKTAERKDIGSRRIRDYVTAIKESPEPIKKQILKGAMEPERAIKIKTKEESEPKLIEDIGVGILICPKCEKKFRVIHRKPKGHKLEEVR